MRQSPGNVDETIKFFKLSEGTREILLKARPGECILNQDGRVTAIKVEMTDFEKEFVTT